MAWTRCHSALIRPHKSSNGRFELRNRIRGGTLEGVFPAPSIMGQHFTRVNEETERARAQAGAQLRGITAMVQWLTHARGCEVEQCSTGSEGGDGYATAREY